MPCPPFKNSRYSTENTNNLFTLLKVLSKFVREGSKSFPTFGYNFPKSAFAATPLGMEDQEKNNRKILLCTMPCSVKLRTTSNYKPLKCPVKYSIHPVHMCNCRSFRPVVRGSNFCTIINLWMTELKKRL